MKKVLAAIVGLIVLLAAAVVLLPGFIDWNDYRDEIARRAEAMTGRELSIGGDIEISLLPTPALVADDVSLANIEGAAAPEMARVKSLEIRIAFAPLLRGAVQVETIRMVDPEIHLERLADGRTNWEFAPQDGAEGSAAAGQAEGGGGAAPDGDGTAVRLDNFLIAGGTLVFRDSMTGVEERIENLDARFAAESLSGPFDSAGSLSFRGVPLHYELATGRVIEGRTAPLNMILRAEPGQTKIDLSGALLDLSGAPRFKGKVVMGGAALATLIDDLLGVGTAPDVLKGAFRVESDITASAAGVDMKQASVSLGEIRVEGPVRVDFADPVTFDAKLAANRIDLDALLAGPEPADAAGNGASTEPPKASAPVPPPTSGAAFAIPDTLTGNLELSIPATSYRGRIVSDAHLDAGIGGGEITVSQLSAQLPGGSEIFATGFVTAENGQPKFDGNLDARFSDLRRVLGWLDVEIPGVPSDRLRKVDFKGRITATPRQIQGTSLNIAVDTSIVTGGVTLALRKRLAFGANLRIDRVNLDAYLNGDGAVSGDQAGPSGGDGVSAGNATGGGGQAGSNPLAFLDVLNSFDANLKLEIGHLSYRRLPLDDVTFDGTLFDGSLDIRRAAVGDFAGANAEVTGKLVGLKSVPGVENLLFDLREVDMVRLLRLFEIEAPVAVREIGIAQLTGQADGTLLRPGFDLIFKTPDASVDLDGRLSVLPVEAMFDGTLKARHGDFTQFLRILGTDYRPSGRIDGVALTTRVKGDPTNAVFEDLVAKIGPVDLSGSLTLDRGGARPRIDADLEAGRIVIDPFLPAQRSAYLESDYWRQAPRKPRVVPASWRPGGGEAGAGLQLAAATVDGRWSAEPLDLSVLQAFDAELKLRSSEVVQGDLSLLDAALEASVEGGVLGVKSLTGKLFGGDLTGSAMLRSGVDVGIEGAALLTGGDFGEVERSLHGRRLATGSIGGRLTFAARGASMADLVSALGGKGSFDIRKVEMKEGGAGGPLGPISGLLNGLNKLGGALLGAENRPDGLADVSGSFTIEQGVATSEDLKLSTNVGDGTAAGTADLAAWDMDVKGDIALSQNLFAKLVSGTTGAELILPFRISGPLDKPNVSIQTSRLPGKVLSIPGQIIDKALDRSGVGSILKRLIPAPQQQQQ